MRICRKHPPEQPGSTKKLKGLNFILKKTILNPMGMFLLGLLLGVASRLLDIYTQNLGNIFPRWPFGFSSES